MNKVTQDFINNMGKSNQKPVEISNAEQGKRRSTDRRLTIADVAIITFTAIALSLFMWWIL